MINPCEKCLLPQNRCICPHLKSIDTRLQVLILQHPQEPGHELGSAQLVQLSLPKAKIRTGLSWPNLKSALSAQEAQPSRWVVLYLGSGVKTPDAQEKVRHPLLQFVSSKGLPTKAPQSGDLDGVIILDGTWSQAKTLWWRNPWLLKLKRAVLNPTEKSLYGKFRKEPRRECLSTLESVAETLVALGEPQEVSLQLKELFKIFLTSSTPKTQNKEQHHS
jgi:DTW domain-containing protein YfiP